MSAILCDLVLLTCGNKGLPSCVESLMATTRLPSHLTLVDNGSDAETKAYLGSVRGNEWVNVRVVTNPTNEGFVLGMNRGMREATAPYVVLLNDDLIFTTGWLERIVEAGKRHPKIGILNPSSNTSGDHPPKGWSAERYAGSLKDHFSGQVIRIATASGFCMVIKQELIQKIGYLDEAYAPLFFEDTDYSCRAADAGYQCAVVKDAYVYHHEHQSFFKVDRQKLETCYERNEAIFTKRWGRSLRVLVPLSLKDGFSSERFQERLDLLSEWAFNRCFLYVPLELSGRKIFQEIEERFSLKEKSGIQFSPFGYPPFFSLYCAYWIFRRRKKPFDCVFCFDEKELGSFLKMVGMLLHLPIFFVQEGKLTLVGGKGKEKKVPFHFSKFPEVVRELLS